jgi:hypothetical protein
MWYEAAIAPAGGEKATLTKFLIISLEDAAALVLQVPAKMHLFLAVAKREILAQLPRFLGGA